MSSLWTAWMFQAPSSPLYLSAPRCSFGDVEKRADRWGLTALKWMEPADWFISSAVSGSGCGFWPYEMARVHRWRFCWGLVRVLDGGNVWVCTAVRLSNCHHSCVLSVCERELRGQKGFPLGVRGEREAVYGLTWHRGRGSTDIVCCFHLDHCN